MNLIERLVAGMEYTGPVYASLPVDTVSTGRGEVLVAAAGWWTQDWQQDGILVVPGELAEDAGSGGWRIGDGSALTAPANADGADLLARRWDAIDYDRTVYLQQLQLLREAYPEFDLDEWTEYILSRPVRDPVRDYLEGIASARPVARVFLVANDQSRVDVLVVDEQGQAATATGSRFLAQAADEWVNRENRPDLETYINWLADQQPYGPYSLTGAAVVEESGLIQDIALRMIR